MFSRIRQHTILAALMVGVLALSAALPVDQFIELARLVILAGSAFAAVCLAVIMPVGMFIEEVQTHALTVLGWHAAPRGLAAVATPTGTPSVLLPPPRSIS